MLVAAGSFSDENCVPVTDTNTLPGFHAVLLDRDGVINDKPKGFVYTWDEFVFLPGVLDSLERLRAAAIPVAVITNQSFIGRGMIEQSAVEAIHDRLREVVAEHGGRIEGVFVCPHAPEAGCECRKPKTRNFELALAQLGVAPDECCFVGDRATDVLAAHNAGLKGYLVRSGAPFDEAEVLGPLVSADGVFTDLAQFVHRLLAARS